MTFSNFEVYWLKIYKKFYFNLIDLKITDVTQHNSLNNYSKNGKLTRNSTGVRFDVFKFFEHWVIIIFHIKKDRKTVILILI